MAKNQTFLNEKARIEKLSSIRELVFGAQDGLLVPLGVVSSVAGAFSNNHIVLVAGIAEALSGAFSMATGAYLSSQAEQQVYISEINKEKEEIANNPQREKKELMTLLENEGLSSENAKIVVDKLATNEKVYIDTHIQKELGIEPEAPGTPVNDAIYVGLSYLFAAIVPLFPYFFVSGFFAILSSIILTLIALFIIGVAKGRVANLSIIKSGVQVLLVGGVSGIGGYFLGVILPHILGIR